MYLNGVMLISSVLDFGTIDFTEGNDQPYVFYLPTYAAVAHYHGKHGDRPLEDVLAEAEEFAARDYPWALARGNRLTAEERADAVARLAALTGLRQEYVDRADLRHRARRGSSPSCCATQRLVVGRLDARFTGPAARTTAETHGTPTPRTTRSAGRTPRRSTTTCATELATPTTCRTSRSAGGVQPVVVQGVRGPAGRRWPPSWRGHAGQPALKVHVAYGYHDGATPYYAAEDVAGPPARSRRSCASNIEHALLPGGAHDVRPRAEPGAAVARTSRSSWNV